MQTCWGQPHLQALAQFLSLAAWLTILQATEAGIGAGNEASWGLVSYPDPPSALEEGSLDLGFETKVGGLLATIL